MPWPATAKMARHVYRLLAAIWGERVSRSWERVPIGRKVKMMRTVLTRRSLRDDASLCRCGGLKRLRPPGGGLCDRKVGPLGHLGHVARPKGPGGSGKVSVGADDRAGYVSERPCKFRRETELTQLSRCVLIFTPRHIEHNF